MIGRVLLDLPRVRPLKSIGHVPVGVIFAECDRRFASVGEFDAHRHSVTVAQRVAHVDGIRTYVAVPTARNAPVAIGAAIFGGGAGGR